VREIGIGTLVLTVAAAIALLAFGLWRVAVGTAIGAGLLVADIYLLKAPFEMMLGMVARRKRPWVLALSLGRIIILGLVLLLLVKFRLANVFGLFIGVTLPMIAIVGMLVTGRFNNKWPSDQAVKWPSEGATPTPPGSLDHLITGSLDHF
jgi:hypothetical protein